MAMPRRGIEEGFCRRPSPSVSASARHSSAVTMQSPREERGLQAAETSSRSERAKHPDILPPPTLWCVGNDRLEILRPFASRTFLRPQVRAPTAMFGSGRAARVGPKPYPPAASYPDPFLRCPSGACSHLRWFPGAASAAADLPPANLLRCPSGTENARSRVEEKPTARVLCSQLLRLPLGQPASTTPLCANIPPPRNLLLKSENPAAARSCRICSARACPGRRKSPTNSPPRCP